MASRLMRSSPDRVVRVRALAGDIVLCSWARIREFVHGRHAAFMAPEVKIR